MVRPSCSKKSENPGPPAPEISGKASGYVSNGVEPAWLDLNMSHARGERLPGRFSLTRRAECAGRLSLVEPQHLRAAVVATRHLQATMAERTKSNRILDERDPGPRRAPWAGKSRGLAGATASSRPAGRRPVGPRAGPQGRDLARPDLVPHAARPPRSWASTARGTLPWRAAAGCAGVAPKS